MPLTDTGISAVESVADAGTDTKLNTRESAPSRARNRVATSARPAAVALLIAFSLALSWATAPPRSDRDHKSFSLDAARQD